jgi:hypothetical protein
VIKILRRTFKLVGSTTGAAFLVAALLASTAIAITAEPTRESYKEQVEPICKQNTESIERILASVKTQIRNGQLKAAAGKFTKAANAFEQATKQLKVVPRPSADSAKLGKWIAQLETGTGLLRKISAALKAEKKGKVASYSSKLTTNSTIANSLVLGFDFDYCIVESSKFT